jgi:hypothetical protein
VNGIGQNNSRCCVFREKWAQKVGIMDRNQMEPFFAAGIEPYRNSRVRRADAIGYQQEKAVESRTRSLVRGPGRNGKQQ